MISCIIAILIVLLLIKILDLQKRVSELETHDPRRQQKTAAVRSTNALQDDGPRVYVIPDIVPRRAS